MNEREAIDKLDEQMRKKEGELTPKPPIAEVEELVSLSKADERYIINEDGAVKKSHLETRIRRLLDNLVQGDDEIVVKEALRVLGDYRILLDGNEEVIVDGCKVAGGQFRAIKGNYGIFLRNDGAHTYILLTASGDQYGAWNALRPFRVDNTTGAIYFGTSVEFDCNLTLNSGKKGCLPVGAMYIQFNGKSAPGDIFTGTWTDQSATWAGRFFRAVGGAAAAFGTAQAMEIQSHSHYFGGSDGGAASHNGAYYNWYWNITTSATGGVETRPINYAVKIWERTA